MIPHILRSVSHASRNSAEIYVAQPPDRLLDLSVSQRDLEGALGGADGAGAMDRNAQLTREHLYRPGALRSARDNCPAVRFAEQQLVRRASCVVRRQVNVESKSVFLVRAAHGDFRERDGQSPMRAVVRRPE